MKESYVKFIAMVSALRGTVRSTEEFTETIVNKDVFKLCVAFVNKNTQEWGYKSGILTKKKEGDAEISQEEAKWKAFFADHTFDSTEQLRNFADAFSIVTGLDLNKYITPVKTSTRRGFPAYVCIVPTRPSGNGHNYRVGEPIINLSQGTTFIRKNGEVGNQMTVLTSEYRLATFEEITSTLANLMLRGESIAEHIVYSMANAED